MTRPPAVGIAFQNRGKWTQIEYDRARRSFEAAAKRAGQSSQSPDLTWFAEHLKDVCEARGRLAGRNYARYVDHYLTINGSAGYVERNRIQAILYESDDFDVLSVDLDPIVGPSRWRRAQQHADDSYTPQYARNCRLHARAWRTFCVDRGANPLAPPSMLFLTWLAEQSKSYSPSTVRNMRNAVSHYLRVNSAEDFTSSEIVKNFLEGVKREKKREPLVPATPDERRAIVSRLPVSGAGIRDRVAVLLTCFTQWGADAMVLIDVEDCVVEETQVSINSPIVAEKLYIGRHAVRDLDIGYWLALLIADVGSGALFRAVKGYEFRYAETALSSQQLLQQVRRAAVAVGLRGEAIGDRLRALYDLEKRDLASETVVSHYDGNVRPRLNRSEARRAAKLMHIKRREKQHL